MMLKAKHENVAFIPMWIEHASASVAHLSLKQKRLVNIIQRI